MNITPEKLRRYAETCEGSTKLIVLAAASTIEDLQAVAKAYVKDISEYMKKNDGGHIE